jgi:putative phosphoesterase
MSKIGVISDTHGLLRPEAVHALRGVDHIVHAGDIGAADVLEALATVAPVTAVRGNNDRATWAGNIPLTAVVTAAEAHLYLLHDVQELDLDPAAAGFAAVISGHSHRPAQHERDGVLYFNPGSAGPRRFNLPIAVGLITVDGRAVRGEIIVLG